MKIFVNNGNNDKNETLTAEVSENNIIMRINYLNLQCKLLST